MELLAPGVYIQEVDLGPRTIQGVSTGTAAFPGPTERGPIAVTLVTSFIEFQRKFGDFLPGQYFLPDSVYGFFANGGKRCYIARIVSNEAVFAKDKLPISGGTAERPAEINFIAIGPGDWGNRINYKIEDASLYPKGSPEQFKFFRLSIAYFKRKPTESELDVFDPNNPGKGVVVERFDNVSLNPKDTSYYKVEVSGASQLLILTDNFDSLTEEELSNLKRPSIESDDAKWKALAGGDKTNEDIKDDVDYNGEDFKSPISDDDPPIKTGLYGLKELEDISIVAAATDNDTISKKILTHCSTLKNCFAILSVKRNDVNKIETLFPLEDNKYGAMYFPWLYVVDQLTGDKKLIPPSGHIAGIYARSDGERGVHKAPANEKVGGIIKLQANIDKGKQEILNPRGINVMRNFLGYGILVWGARTMSKDPLWKYINVRRLFIFLEKSVETSTQWAVFEPNNEKLWSRIKASLVQFLTKVWKDGALMGTTPEEAFFVKADRTTMTQYEIDNGIFIALIGVAPTNPAEFVVFKFAQTPSGISIQEI